MFLASAPIALIFSFAFRFGDAITMIAVGISLVVIDLAFRFLINTGEPRIFGKTTGGYFLFVPVWLLGILVIVLNMINSTGVFK